MFQEVQVNYFLILFMLLHCLEQLLALYSYSQQSLLEVSKINSIRHILVIFFILGYTPVDQLGTFTRYCLGTDIEIITKGHVAFVLQKFFVARNTVVNVDTFNVELEQHLQFFFSIFKERLDIKASEKLIYLLVIHFLQLQMMFFCFIIFFHI